MVQGPAYKKTLQLHLDAVQELTKIIDQEAIVRSQHRLRDVEKYVIGIEKELKGLQDSSRSPMADEAWKQNIIARIGDYCAERVVNSMLSHLASNSCIGGGMTWSWFQNPGVSVCRLISVQVPMHHGFWNPQDQPQTWSL